MTKPHSLKGKISLRRYFQKLASGDKVLLAAEPAIQKGLYHQRFHGRIGTVMSIKGTNYLVKLNDLGKDKTLVLHPVHLRKI
jgi:large subunit ribosomal protein L21e